MPGGRAPGAKGLQRLGLVRGVYAAIMVLATAVGPWALGVVFDAGWPLGAVAGALVAYTLMAPRMALRWLAVPPDSSH